MNSSLALSVGQILFICISICSIVTVYIILLQCAGNNNNNNNNNYIELFIMSMHYLLSIRDFASLLHSDQCINFYNWCRFTHLDLYLISSENIVPKNKVIKRLFFPNSLLLFLQKSLLTYDSCILSLLLAEGYKYNVIKIITAISELCFKIYYSVPKMCQTHQLSLIKMFLNSHEVTKISPWNYSFVHASCTKSRFTIYSSKGKGWSGS